MTAAKGIALTKTVVAGVLYAEWEAENHPSARFPFAYVHQACGYPAFYVRRAIPFGSLLKSKDAANLQGGPIAPFSQFRCGHCHEQLPMPPASAHIQELLPS